MQKIAIELLVILQKSEMTYAGQEQQTGIWDFSGHEFGILALDRLVVIAVNDPDRYCNCGKLLCGKIWLCRPHSGYLVEEGIVRLWRWRELLIFRLRPGNKFVEYRALCDVLDARRIGIGGKCEEFCYSLRMTDGDVQSQNRSIAPAGDRGLSDLQIVHECED